jgi:hypothetical protein
MNLELKDILAIWGAVTGTVGTIVAIHVWRLNRRLSTPRLIITRAAGKMAAETERGVELQFQCSLASQSNVAATVEWFELDLGRKLNRTTTTWARYDGAVRPRLTHCTTPGTAGSPVGKPGLPGDWDRPVVVPANGVIPSVHLTAKVYARDNVDTGVPVQLKERLRNGRYSLIARLVAGREVALGGKDIELAEERSA